MIVIHRDFWYKELSDFLVRTDTSMSEDVVDFLKKTCKILVKCDETIKGNFILDFKNDSHETLFRTKYSDYEAGSMIIFNEKFWELVPPARGRTIAEDLVSFLKTSFPGLSKHDVDFSFGVSSLVTEAADGADGALYLPPKYETLFRIKYSEYVLC